VRDVPALVDGGAILIQDMLTQAKMVVVDAPLGADGAHTDVAELGEVTRQKAMLQPPCL
jgi:hypothetical protein